MIKIDEEKIKKELFARTEGYAAGVRAIYLDVMQRLISLALEIEPDYDPERAFSFSDYPLISDRANSLLRELYSRLYQQIQYGIRNEWEQANIKADELVMSIFGANAIGDKRFSMYFNRNKKAMDAFFSRTRQDGGLNLSQRIWKYEGQFRQDMELAIDCYLGQGMSANRMATLVKGFLQDPDRLYRRVRNERGELVLSKNAKSYHPGAGQYRSSYRNAQRFTRSETNIAYRTADFERWSQLDFVVGIEIRVSDNHPERDICDELSGRYPKDFKFVGWHPNCRCHAVAILASDEEISTLTDMILMGEDISRFQSKVGVKRPPKAFVMWIRNNQDRINEAASLPYFIRDNSKYVKTYS